MNNQLKTLIWSCLLLLSATLSAQPVLNCANINRQLDITGTVMIQPFDINGGSSGYSNYSINGQSQLLLTCANIGVNNVMLIGTDSLGNSDTCIAIVSVMDVIPPSVICQNITVWLSPTSQSATIMPADINNGSSDNCGIANLTVNGQASLTFGTQDIGNNMVTLTATDFSGNSANCIAIVTVNATGLGPISGRVVLDTNLNCLSDAPEVGVIGSTIHLQSATHSYHFYSDQNGNYAGTIDTGTYTATFYPPVYYNQPCQTTQIVVMDTTYTPQVLDWQVQTQITCPFMNVDIGTPFIRTNSTSYYTVNYCNGGNATAQNAYIDVTLDPFMSYSSSTLSGTALGNNVYRFYLGNVAPGYCNSFYVYFSLSGAYLGQTHCSEAHIYPDSFCLPSLWSGAELAANGLCLNDTITFAIVNNGADMSSTRSYYLYEDSTMIQLGPVMLLSGQSMSIVVAAQPGKTYRLIAEQESGYPSILGDSVTTTFIENCNTLGFPNMSRGFGTNFSNGNSSPMIAVDCRQNIGSYDPNDKSAQPEGYGAAHYIYDYTPLDYTVRFQNTGTDTAFNVYILDTLSHYLNPASLQMGASSHAYTWEMLPNNVLKVSFNNIMLPDSNVNEPESNGFFKYRIEQQQGNVLGTVIENRAAIYFDANLPVITNTTFHTIGEDFIASVVSVEKVSSDNSKLNFELFPNPTKGHVNIILPGLTTQKLLLTDVLGRVLREVNVDGLVAYEIDLSSYPSGTYFWTLGTGKSLMARKLVLTK